jgi:hypothetical protein
VEPEKQPLLANGSKTAFICMQLFGENVPGVTDNACKSRDTFRNNVFYSVRADVKEDN